MLSSKHPTRLTLLHRSAAAPGGQRLCGSPVPRPSATSTAASISFSFLADSLPGPAGPSPGEPGLAEDDGFDARRERSGYRLRVRSRVLRIPRSLWGRIAAAVGLLALAGGLSVSLLALRRFFLHDGRFIVASSSSIQIAGNTHLSHAQLLSVFGEDVERNIFAIPLGGRRDELEQLPWVAHATVMRLLPNRLRISVTERTPVAFVRQATQDLSQIGLVDASGVLLDIPPDAPGDPQYSFPVVSGINAADPLSTRAARMKIYTAFTTDLDSEGGHISQQLSEVDLSNPEDVKAVLREGSGAAASEVLVHFGDSDFLARYKKFEQHLPEWRTQYPKLASVDMRYERQVVLEMQAGVSTAAADTTPLTAALTERSPATHKAATKSAIKPVAPTKTGINKPTTKPAGKANAKTIKAAPAPGAAPAANSADWHMVVAKPHTQAKASGHPGNASRSPQTSHPAHPSQAAQQ